MKVLINLLPIKKGGGQQVASNFIVQILKDSRIKPFFVVTKGTFIHKRLEQLGVNPLFVIDSSIFSRFIFTNFQVNKIVKEKKISLIYTMFGPGLFSKYAKSITGCAYSNLFYPEIDFWQGYPFHNKLKRRLIDRYRLKNTLKSDAIVFENEAMQKRCVKLFNYPQEDTSLIFPSVSEYETQKNSETVIERLKVINENDFNVALITGWHKNKNIEIVPEVLKELKKKGYNNVKFVITINPKHNQSKKLIEKATKYQVNENLILFGSIFPNEIPLFLKKMDSIALFSLLESFSNNIIEAWTFRKLLIISDEEWSKTICKDTAVYVNRNDAKDITNKIIDLLENKIDTIKINENVEKILKSYPNPVEKVSLQIDYLLKKSNQWNLKN